MWVQLLSIPFYVWGTLGAPARQQAYLQLQLQGAQGEGSSSPPASSGRRSPTQLSGNFSMSSSGAPCCWVTGAVGTLP